MYIYSGIGSFMDGAAANKYYDYIVSQQANKKVNDRAR